MSKSIMPSEPLQHFGGICVFGCNDGKVSAGEMRPQAGGDVATRANRERVCGGEGKRHRVMKVVWPRFQTVWGEAEVPTHVLKANCEI